MKEKMEKERTDEETKNNDLKIGSGGLIDLEFLVQAVQLKHYSADAQTDTRNSFAAMDQLASSRQLSARDVAIVSRNYRFLRQLELAVRINSDTNRFVLPDDKNLRQLIAAGVGLKTASELRNRLSSVRKENRQLMKKVFSALK